VIALSSTNQHYDPLKMSDKLKDMLMNGDTTELPNYIQEILMQSVTNPLTQAILAPLAQSLAAPLSQFFSSPMHSNPANKPVVQVDPVSEVPNSLNPQLFEIHGFAVIRTIIPDDVSEKDIKVLIASSHVTIKGDPSGNEHIIPLPQGSKKEGAVAAFKNRILEIKIPREIETEASDEVDVQYF
jgi:hypothetical protein